MDFTIIPAQPEHFLILRTIELAAFETLRCTGAVSGHASANSLEELSDFYHNGLLFSACTPDSGPVGFAAGQIEDTWLHIAEIDVHPDWQRKGIGRQLMLTILSTGQRLGLTGATLTTDNQAVFNARFYASLGFKTVESHTQPPYLARLSAAEIASGFNPARRVAMKLVF